MNGVSCDTRSGRTLPVSRASRRRRAIWLGVVGCALLAASPWGAGLIADVDPATDENDAQRPDAPLVAVVIEGNTTIASDEIAKRIKSRAGRGADEKQIKEDVRSLYATKWFFTIEPRFRHTDEGWTLVFKVSERPILKKVEYKGNEKIKTKDLDALTGMKVGGAFDVGVNREAARRIESHYREKGYMHVEVTLERGDSKDDREVVFRIKEGPKVHVTKISFLGNKFFSDSLLMTKVKTKTRKFWLFGGKYDPAGIPDDISALKDYYHSLGFFDVRIAHREKTSADRSEIHIEYTIDEGQRYKIRGVEIAGNAVIAEGPLRKDLKVVPNDFFNERKMNADVEKITGQYGELGHIFCKVEAQLKHTEEPGVVSIRYDIDEDQPYRVRRINVHIEGEHPHTKESVVLNRMLVKPGDLANPSLIKKSERRIAGSQIFTGAQPGTPGGPRINVSKGGNALNRPPQRTIVRAQGLQESGPPNSSPLGANPQNDPIGPIFDEPPPGWVDLHDYVSETQTGKLSFGVGINSNAGILGTAMLQENNFDIMRPPTSFQDVIDGTAFRGGGQQFRLEAVPGNQLSRYMVSWSDPYFLDHDVSFGVSGFYYTRFFPNWNEQRTGGRITAGRQFTPWLSSSLALRIENVNLSRPSLPTPDELSRALGDNFLSTIRINLVHDTRDTPFMAGKGHYLEAGYEQGIADFVYPRADVEARQYFTLKERPDGGNRHIVTVAGQLGWAGNNTPIFEKFYAGGFQSFRGFQFYGVTPRANGVRVGGFWQALGTVEYMMPVTANDMLQLVAFTDFGTVQQNVGFQDFRLTVGGGIRVTIPMMGPVPIAIDFGVPILQQGFDTRQLVSFYVGLMK